MSAVKYAVAWLLCAAALAVAGCAHGSDGMRQVIANTAVTIAAGYRTLGVVDGQAQDRIRAQAKDDPRAATVALEEHLRRYDVARKALGAGVAIVESANAAVPLVEAGLASEKSASTWIADLVTAGLAVASALHNLGVL